MVDQEVVDILADIKQRVAAAQSTPTYTDDVFVAPVNTTQPVARHDYAGLSVLARAWDRLPPLVSNRTGSSARLELWIKAKLKNIFRWFTWEQVNFNAATHQTLVELVDSLHAYEQTLAVTHTELTQLREALSQQQEQVEKDRRGLIEQQQTEFQAQRAEFQSRLEALQTALAEIKLSTASEAQTRFTELVNEFRERDERLLDEQRVCFKQLSLELTESQVLEERARRDLDARLSRVESELREASDK